MDTFFFLPFFLFSSSLHLFYIYDIEKKIFVFLFYANLNVNFILIFVHDVDNVFIYVDIRVYDIVYLKSIKRINSFEWNEVLSIPRDILPSLIEI